MTKAPATSQEQGMLLPPPAIGAAAAAYEEHGGVYFKVASPELTSASAPEAPVSDRAARLQSLLKTVDLLGQIQQSSGYERSHDIPREREDRARRYGGELAARARVEHSVEANDYRNRAAKEAFAHATGHDKRLERMPAEQARTATRRAYDNFNRKYFPAEPTLKAANARRRLRRKVNRLIEQA